MSVQKWKQKAAEKSAVDQQTHEILQKFKMNSIGKEFGQLSGEELFKTITKRLDKTNAGQEKAGVEENPDYTMDEFDRINPFGDDFRPEAPTPAPSPTSSPAPSQPPPFPDVDVDGDDKFPQPPPTLEETSILKTWGEPGPVEYEYPHKSTLLQTVNQLITKYGNDPHYKVKSKESRLFGYSIEDLKKVRDGIYEKRRATQSLSKQLQEGKQRLKPPPPRKSKEPPPSPLEKAVMSRRPDIEPSDDEDDFPEQDWETEGSCLMKVSPNEIINQLWVCNQVSQDYTINFNPPIYLYVQKIKAIRQR